MVLPWMGLVLARPTDAGWDWDLGNFEDGLCSVPHAVPEQFL